MTILFDATSDVGNANQGDLNWNHTNSGSLLVIEVFSQDPLSSSLVATYNGIAMTLVTAVKNSINAGIVVFSLPNAPTGTYTIQVTDGGASLKYGVSTSFFNAGGVDSFGTSVNNTNTNTTLAVSTTVVKSNCWLVSAAGIVFNTGSGSDSSTLTMRVQNSFIYFSQTGGLAAATTSTTVSPGVRSDTHTWSKGGWTSAILISIFPSDPNSSLFFAGD